MAGAAAAGALNTRTHQSTTAINSAAATAVASMGATARRVRGRRIMVDVPGGKKETDEANERLSGACMKRSTCRHFLTRG